MNLYLRFFLLLVKRLFIRKRSGVFDACTTKFRVAPSDMDLNFHMNNGKYLSIMDLGRFDIMLKAKVFYTLIGRGYYPVISSESIRFKRSLGFLQRFDLVTQIEAWEGKDYYMTQKFICKGRVVAEGYIKGRFKKRKQKGSVPLEQLFEEIGLDVELAKMNAMAELQKKIESELTRVREE